ncbi:MAG: hypothetical protein A2008_10880 [Candidatus Wallbacteria bacterium GWC2_49_35]|uniref:DUF302 domain-containing protein n=1 Tax=Candidatus Wallbacteria bacterium GWC2_49_35 TaxID=1817813 RepID=A0A1F7WU35_9BACT|nr:MAG: hypothetical protein A2008_10880 [Candidatus Wallbacteria bacterium GWC2_49_35]
MKEKVMPFLIGGLTGVFAVLLSIFLFASNIMVLEDESPWGYDEAVKIVREKSAELKWSVPAVHELHKSMEKAGYQVQPAAVIEICRPDYAAEILQADKSRNVTSLMPCRIALYKTSDGKTVVSRMNTGLMSRLFGGKVTEVMAKATADSEQIISALLKK